MAQRGHFCPHCATAKSKRSKTTFDKWLDEHLAKWCEYRVEYDENPIGQHSPPEHNDNAQDVQLGDDIGVIAEAEVGDAAPVLQETIAPQGPSDQAAGQHCTSQPRRLLPFIVHDFCVGNKLTTVSCERLLTMLREITSDDDLMTELSNLPRTFAALERAASAGDIAARSQHQLVVEELPCSKLPFAYFRLRGVISSLLAMWRDCKKPPSERLEQRRAVCKEMNQSPWSETFAQYEVAGIILYLDGIAIDFFGRISVTPIFVSLANFDNSTRDTLEAKRLLGFVPVGTSTVTVHEALDRVVQEILEMQASGVDGYRPVLACIVGDNKEAQAIAGVKGGDTYMKCRICEIPREQMHDYRLRYPRRSLNDSDQRARGKRARDGFLKQRSLHSHATDSMLYKHFRTVCGHDDHTKMLPMDLLHTVHGGIVRYAVIWTLDIAQALGANVQKIDDAVDAYSKIASPTDVEWEFDVPSKSLRHLNSSKPSGKFPTRQWPALLMALGCAISCTTTITNSHGAYGNVRDFVVRTIFAVLDLFFELNKREYLECELGGLEMQLTPTVLEALTALYCLRQQLQLRKSRTPSENAKVKRFKGIKLHLVTHYAQFIRFYGAPRGWDTATFETANKTIKQFYRAGRKNIATLETDMLKQEQKLRFWEQACSAVGIGERGEISTNKTEVSVGTRTKDGARNEIRRWKVIQLLDTHITYRFWKAGYAIDVVFKDLGKIDHTTMSWKLKAKHDNYQPHPKMMRFLLETLELYANTLPLNHIIRSIFDPTEQAKLSVSLHGHVTIAGTGTFEGFSNFSVHANRAYGSVNRRARFDLVEVAIPSDVGGGIADDPHLLRTSPDTAIAAVVGILAVAELSNETCVLIVNFLSQISDSNKRTLQATANVCTDFGNFYIGKLEPTWLAAYPLHTLKAPVLALPAAGEDSVYFVFPLNYISRDRWQGTSATQRPLAAVSGLKPLEARIAELEPLYASWQESDSEADSSDEELEGNLPDDDTSATDTSENHSDFGRDSDP